MWSATSQRTGAPFFPATTTTAPTTTRSRPPTRTGRVSPEKQHEQHEQQTDDRNQTQPPPPPPQQAPAAAAAAAPRLSKKPSRTTLQKKASFSRIRRGSSSVVGFGSDSRTAAPPPDEQRAHVRAKSVSSVPAGRSDSHPPPLPATTSTAAAAAAASGAPPTAPPKMMGTSVLLGPYATAGYSTVPSVAMSSVLGQSPEGAIVHQHIHDVANKRISTLDYLRKAQEGRVYWFNTLRYDRPDLARMPYFDARRLARRATNYLLLGLSIPAVVDLNGTNATDLLRSFGALLAEFESFQQLHAETGSGSGGASSLSRAARLPHMFRRATPGSKVRRTSSSATASEYDGGASPVGSATSPGGIGGVGSGGLVGSGSSGGSGGGGGGGSGGVASLDGTLAGSALTLVNSESAGSLGIPLTPTPSHGQHGQHGLGLGVPGTALATTPSVIGDPLSAASTPGSTSFATYYDNNTDLLPGEEYALLLTPSLPFDPDFFETFATLCDVLIDCYTRILGLLPTPRECTPVVVELFNKADARVRKLLVQGVVKEFEDNSRAGVRTEVANIGRVVLGGLMG